MSVGSAKIDEATGDVREWIEDQHMQVMGGVRGGRCLARGILRARWEAVGRVGDELWMGAFIAALS